MSSSTLQLEIPTDPDAYLTTRQAATLLGMAVAYLHNMRSQGRGPAYKRVSGRMVRYRRRDLIAWMEAHTYHCTAEYRG